MGKFSFAQRVLLAGCAMGAITPARATLFSVAEQSAQSGITTFARQAGVQLIVPARLVANKRTNAVSGEMDNQAALKRLLEGTGLRVRRNDGRTIILGQSDGGAIHLASLSAQDMPPASAAAAEPVVASPPAAADAAAAAVIDGGEILVTARRTTERLQDVPVAVTALGADALARRSVDTLDQIAKYTPNIRFDGAAALSGGNYNATVFIRGVGQNDFAIFSDPGVGFYVDDVYYARSIGGVMDAIDLSGVQVLRGPQGTLFGKNTIGGAVLISTTNPELNRFSAKLEGTVGSYARKDLKGAINIPIADNLAALRISAATLHRDGYVKRLLTDDTLGNRDANMVRAKLRVTPGDKLTIDLGADYTRARENSAPSKLLAAGDASVGLAGVPFLANYNRFVAPTLSIVAPDGRHALDGSFVTNDPFTTYATGPNANDLDLYGVQGIVSYRMGGATLKSVSAYRHMKAYFTRDGDNTPYTFRQTTNRDHQWQFSQELQLTGKTFDDRLSYVVGGFYFKEKASDIATADLAVGLWPPLVTTPPASPAVFIQNYTNNRSLAAYGQVDFEVLPRLSLSAGARYTSDRKVYTSINTRQSDLVQFVNVTKSATFEKFTPHFGISYKADRDVLLYATFSRGFKQGGFNGRPLASAAEVTEYEPETLDTYEAGIKSQLLDRKLTANLAYFHSIYKNIQLTVNQTPQNFVANAAAGKIDGLEMELVARPVSWFSANFGLGYLHARYTSVGQGLGPTQILPITLASKFVKAPKFTINAGAEVIHRLADDSEITLRGDLSAYSRIYQDVANTPLITEPGYELLNARLSYRLPGGRIEFAVFGTNLADARYFVSGNASASFGLAEVSYGRPREWGASAGIKF